MSCRSASKIRSMRLCRRSVGDILMDLQSSMNFAWGMCCNMSRHRAASGSVLRGTGTPGVKLGRQCDAPRVRHIGGAPPPSESRRPWCPPAEVRAESEVHRARLQLGHHHTRCLHLLLGNGAQLQGAHPEACARHCHLIACARHCHLIAAEPPYRASDFFSLGHGTRRHTATSSLVLKTGVMRGLASRATHNLVAHVIQYLKSGCLPGPLHRLVAQNRAGRPAVLGHLETPPSRAGTVTIRDDAMACSWPPWSRPHMQTTRRTSSAALRQWCEQRCPRTTSHARPPCQCHHGPDLPCQEQSPYRSPSHPRTADPSWSCHNPH